MICRNRNTKYKLTCVGRYLWPQYHPWIRSANWWCPLNILVWPNAVARSYPVCDISKYVATLDLLLKRYLCYLQLFSTETSAGARSPDTGTTMRPGTTRGCLDTAHGFPSCAVLNATGHAASTMPLSAQTGSLGIRHVPSSGKSSSPSPSCCKGETASIE